MNRSYLLALSCGFLLGCSDQSVTPVAPPDAPLLAASTFTEDERFFFSLVAFIPCAADGAGEFVELSGTLHALFHVTLDASGGAHVKTHFQPQGIKGIGLTTGDKYQGTGVTQDQFNARVGETFTYINNFRIIGQGPRNNLLIHETVHVTVNANGTVTASVENFSEECT